MGRIARKIAIAAVAPLLAVLGVAVATTTASAHTPSVVTTTGGGAVPVSVQHIELRPSVHKVTTHAKTVAPELYRVVSGDNLSSIAKAHNTPHGWAGLYALNRSTVGSNPNLIQVGEHLKLTGPVTSTQLRSAYDALPTSVPAPVHHYSVTHHSVDTDDSVNKTTQPSAPVQKPQSAPVQQQAPAPAPVHSQAAVVPQSSSGGGISSVSDLSGAWQCIVQHESGGQNLSYGDASSTGYFQIQQPTWNDYGGTAYAPSPYLATLDQQYQVALKILAAQGPSAWSTNASFGCGL